MNPQIARISEWITRFHDQSLSLTALWQNINAISPAMESDIPERIRKAIESAANQLELIDVMNESETATQKAKPVIMELQTLLSEALMLHLKPMQDDLENG